MLGNQAIADEYGKNWGIVGLELKDVMEYIQPASVDLPIDRIFSSSKGDLVEIPFLDVPSQGFALARTKWRIWFTNNLAGQLATRSSVIRKGADCCLSAGFVDPSYKGHVTLELTNHGRDVYRFISDECYCQIKIFRVEGCTMGYNGKYGEKDGHQNILDMFSKGTSRILNGGGK